MHYQLGIQIEGELFEAVANSKLFTDSKVFVDSIPKKEPSKILYDYKKQKDLEGFSLKSFIFENFTLPEEFEPTKTSLERKLEMFEYIDQYWDKLLKALKPQAPDSTLIALPEKHIIPGGRFRECYYWDTYFIIEGLFASKREDIVDKLVKNLGYLIDKHGFIPNGNRLYYLTRSQQPYFSLILAALFREGKEKLALSYYPQLLQEYDFWMRGQELITKEKPFHDRVVSIRNLILNRYYDETNHPRPEGYCYDRNAFDSASKEERVDLYRNIKAACESGWDFSSRWCLDSNRFTSICTTDLLPIDLNCLLYHMEITLYKFGEILNHEKIHHFKRLAEKRKEWILEYFWDKERDYFFDYNFKKQQKSQCYSLAAVMPLFMNIATSHQAKAVANTLEKILLLEGGFATTSVSTGMQWDYPYGWAPLQFLAYVGLKNYGFDDLADRAARSFVRICQKNYNLYGTLSEKYDMKTSSLGVLAGEYPSQEGFGWTNAILKVFQNSL
jgi:alpha,alpha-trehalase